MGQFSKKAYAVLNVSKQNNLQVTLKVTFTYFFPVKLSFKKIENLAPAKKRCLRFDSGTLIPVRNILRNKCLRLLRKLGYHFCAFINAIKKL